MFQKRMGWVRIPGESGRIDAATCNARRRKFVLYSAAPGQHRGVFQFSLRFHMVDNTYKDHDFIIKNNNLKTGRLN